MSSIITSFLYLSTLLLGLAGLLFWDYSKKIVFFRNAKVGAKIIASAVGFFLLWDVLGIALAIFHTNKYFVSGFYFLTPDLPIEEILFLSFFSYLVLMLNRSRVKS